MHHPLSQATAIVECISRLSVGEHRMFAREVIIALFIALLATGAEAQRSAIDSDGRCIREEGSYCVDCEIEANLGPVDDVTQPSAPQDPARCRGFEPGKQIRVQLVAANGEARILHNPNTERAEVGISLWAGDTRNPLPHQTFLGPINQPIYPDKPTANGLVADDKTVFAKITLTHCLSIHSVRLTCRINARLRIFRY